jgi:hypothetical protein
VQSVQKLRVSGHGNIPNPTAIGQQLRQDSKKLTIFGIFDSIVISVEHRSADELISAKQVANGFVFGVVLISASGLL